MSHSNRNLGFCIQVGSVISLWSMHVLCAALASSLSPMNMHVNLISHSELAVGVNISVRHVQPVIDETTTLGQRQSAFYTVNNKASVADYRLCV